MLRGLFKLTWLEIKIFVREPMGVVGTVLIPVLMFLVIGRSFAASPANGPNDKQFFALGLPIFISLFIAINAALSLVAVISIYREGGILKRLRATPLRPWVILGAHVLVKLVFTGASLALMALAGKRFYPIALHVHVAGFALAVIVTTVAIITMGFVVASMVPTARFAQVIGSMIFYPMVALSGLFVPLRMMPRAWAMAIQCLPITHAVSLLRGAWVGTSWVAMWQDLGALALTIALCLALSTRVFRWE